MRTNLVDNNPIQSEDHSRNWAVDDEIDLRQYVQTLIEWWREILFFMSVAVLIAFITLFTQRFLDTPTYRATTTVAIARVKSDITFDERYRTSSDTSITTLQTSANSRRAALLGLVYSGSIAESVIAELRNMLNESEREPSALLKIVQSEIIKRSDNNVESDLIAINVVADSPAKATAIANAWAKHYVEQVNTLYGQVPPEVLASVEDEMQNAKAVYELAQDALETFVADNQVKKLQRLITEKQGIIDSLQIGKQTAIDALVEEELNARRQIISAYINALSSNRLLAFTKEQEAKRALIGAYIDADIENRLLAINKDREARTLLFNTFATGQISATLSVFTQQVNDAMSQLDETYKEYNRLSQFLASARLLQGQVEAGGDAATATNGLALLLLKSQVFAQTEDGLPANMQINFDGAVNSSAADQFADLAALIDVLENRVAALEEEIQTLSAQLVQGDSYQNLDQISASHLTASSLVTGTAVAQAAASSLSVAVAQRYAELFDTGGLVGVSQEMRDESALVAEIAELYPELFTLDDLSQVANNVWEDSTLATASVDKAQELLQLQGLEDVSAYTDTAERLNVAIEQLEGEIQALEAQLEAESARELQLVQQRDLGWETFKTLSNKVAELRLERNATDSEVRLAVPAIPPTEPLPGIVLLRNVVLAGAVGLLLGIFVAFLASFMGREPFLSRPRDAPSPP